MIFSYKYKYVFIENPQTGCSAIRKELIEKYAGEPILRKHAHYREFLSQANAEEKRYFAFSTIRNPMDQEVSRYFKLKNDHNKRFTKRLDKSGLRWLDETRLSKKFKYVQKEISFSDYFIKFNKFIPCDSPIFVYQDCLDFIIRYENINDDFMIVLKKLNIIPVRKLPVYNVTEGKGKDFYSY